MMTAKLGLALLLFSASVWAEKAAELEYIVNQIMEQQGALFVEYDIAQNGKVTVLFGANEPEWRIQSTLKALQSHPDIAARLFWTRTDSEFCAIR
ncbi:MAG: hypothetical protein AB1591_09900 [Pseudomonadota bacterium]